MKELEKKLNYCFKDISLLKNALTHSSYANENRDEGMSSNERLEFLGDSVLGFATAKYLYAVNPALPEGKMTRLRAELVCEQSLYGVAADLNLGEYLRMGRGEERNGGRKRVSILADAVEAVIAAMYLDGGFEPAERFIKANILNPESIEAHHSVDYKTELQELVQQKSGQVLTYIPAGESGPDHDKTFAARVSLNGEVIGEGQGRTKKEAEQAAACEALKKLTNNA
ncbi:MAG: ribonuclease III [Bacillota bacterium]|nr:ribonuclease III [Bacillota bacterium]